MAAIHGSDLPTRMDQHDVTYESGMERLTQAIRDLASAHDLDEVVEVVRHAARELADADGATFVLRESEKCFYVDEDAIAPLWRGLRFPMEACISGWAMLHKESVVIPDIYVDDRIPQDAYRPTFVKSLAMTPIRTADPIGAIGTYWATLHEATPTETRLLQALADSTAVALENVRILTELEDRVAIRTAQLASANADLRQFAAIAAHDLRNPLATLTGFAELLTRELGDSEGRVGIAVDAIGRTSARLVALVDKLLAFAQAGSSELTTDTVNLDEVMSSVLTELHHLIAERNAHVECGSLGAADGDRTLLRQAIQNLVVNALTYVRDGVPPRLRIDTVRADDTVTLRVSDNGPGVPSVERERILEPFARGAAAAGHPGSGLGLAICRRVAEHHGGRLEIGDAPEGGSEFSIVLPAR
ncbi:MAG: GAF domain-containing sensor histidine kinase [Actinomycetota bacterium]